MTPDTPQPTQKPSLPARLLRPKVAVPLTLLLLLILSPFLIRGYHLARIPNVGEPFDIEARYALVVPDDENAYVEYREAAALYVAPSPQVEEDREAVIEYGWSHATPELEQHLRDNEPALSAWRRGTEKDDAQYYLTTDLHMYLALPVDDALTKLARDALAIARKLEADGMASEAWRWYRVAIRSSRHCGRNGGFVERILGTQIFSRTADRLVDWSADTRLSSEHLLFAVADVRLAEKLTAKTSSLLETEYITAMSTISHYESGREGAQWPDALQQEISTDRFSLFIRAEPEVTRRIFRFHLRNHLLFCDRPPFQRPLQRGVPNLFDDARGLTVGEDTWEISDMQAAFERSILTQFFLYSTSHLYERVDRELVHLACLPVVLAGQAYHRDHNRFPATLGELVPDYLPEIPIDPFDGLPLKYRLDDEGAVVYSVFQDGIDNGGFRLDGATTIVVHPGGPLIPMDLGLRLHAPGERPLVAPKPRVSN